MDFKPGEVSGEEASKLNWMHQEVVRLSNLRVAGPSMRLYRGPANIVIESTAGPAPVIQSGSGSGLIGSGSGSSDRDLFTVQFDALSDVTGTIDLNVQVDCVDGKVVVTVATATLNLTKTWERIRITGPDLTITTQCDVGQACQ